jgi:hypothetical protein
VRRGGGGGSHLNGFQTLHNNVHALSDEVVIGIHMRSDESLELLRHIVACRLPFKHVGSAAASELERSHALGDVWCRSA